ncbi:MAG: hypothetical protein IJ192_03640 [Clostridia bacterium]|nr:hypothetical protein [Clostridia bacterium]MBR2175335.1 hypothetical protein [Clostridia bacterium]
MANTNKKRAKSMINVRRATFFGFSDEDNEVYDESKIMELTKRTMSFSDGRNYNSVPNYGDGEETDREYGISGRTVELQIHDLTAEESAFIHGHTVSGKTIRRSQNDIIPSVGLALMTDLPGGHVNLYKFYKAKFPPSGTSVTQKSEGSTTFSNTTLSGTYSDLERLGTDSSILKDVDPDTEEGKQIINNWFTKPDYDGGATDNSGGD